MNKNTKNKNLSWDKIVLIVIGVVAAILLINNLYRIYNNTITPASEIVQNYTVPTIAPIQNEEDLNKVTADLDNSDLEAFDSELQQIDSEASF